MLGLARQVEALFAYVVVDGAYGGVLAGGDVHEASTSDEGLQRHHRLEGRGDHHLEAERLEDVHRHGGELRVGLIEGLVEHHRGEARWLAIAASELIAKGRSQDRGRKLLALTARLAGATPVD